MYTGLLHASLGFCLLTTLGQIVSRVVTLWYLVVPEKSWYVCEGMPLVTTSLLCSPLTVITSSWYTEARLLPHSPWRHHHCHEDIITVMMTSSLS